MLDYRGAEYLYGFSPPRFACMSSQIMHQKQGRHHPLREVNNFVIAHKVSHITALLPPRMRHTWRIGNRGILSTSWGGSLQQDDVHHSIFSREDSYPKKMPGCRSGTQTEKRQEKANEQKKWWLIEESNLQKRGYEPGQKSGTVTPVDQSLSRDFLNPALGTATPQRRWIGSVAVPVEGLGPRTCLYTSSLHYPQSTSFPVLLFIPSTRILSQ
jgi:hypothetical protein